MKTPSQAFGQVKGQATACLIVLTIMLISCSNDVEFEPGDSKRDTEHSGTDDAGPKPAPKVTPEENDPNSPDNIPPEVNTDQVIGVSPLVNLYDPRNPDADTITVDAASSLELSWVSSFADYCVASWDEPDTLQGMTGAATINDISETTHYTVTCFNANGQSEDSIEVIVSKQPVVTLLANGSPDNIGIVQGDEVDVTWTSVNTETCVLIKGDKSSDVPTNGSSEIEPDASITITLICENLSGDEASASIEIAVGNQPTVQLFINGSKGEVEVGYGKEATLTWTSISADSCQIKVGEKSYDNQSPLGSMLLTAMQSSAVNITCSNSFGKATDSGSIKVTADTPEVIANLCKDLPKLTIKKNLNFPKTENCDFNAPGNGPAMEAKFMARTVQTKSINVPEGFLLCEITDLSSKEDNIQYDDFMFISLSNYVITASNGNVTDYLTSLDDIYLWDWAKIHGKDWNEDKNLKYCLGAGSTCEFPGHDEAGAINIKLDQTSIFKLSTLFKEKDKIDVKVISTGDNDDGDCYHSQFKLDVELKYVEKP